MSILKLCETLEPEKDSDLDGSTHPCSAKQSAGGVGRNIAEVLWKLRQGKTRLLTVVGDDAEGRFLVENVPGLILDGCVVKGGRTPTYAAVLDAAGECRLGLGDMTLYDHISTDLVEKHMDLLTEAPIVVIDGNVPQPTMKYVIQLCNNLQKPVFFEPTDTRKGIKPLQYNQHLTYASPNIAELRTMAMFVNPHLKINSSDELTVIMELAKTLSNQVKNIIVTIGSKGVVIIRNENNMSDARLYPADNVHNIVNVSGAGDCFAGGYIHGILSRLTETQCVGVAFQTARAALLSSKTVPDSFKVDLDIPEVKFVKLPM